MSDRHDRHEFLQLIDEVMNFGDADQLTANDGDLEFRAQLLFAYFKDPIEIIQTTNESDPRWAGSIDQLGGPPGPRSVRAGTDDHTSVREWLSDFFDP